MGEESSNTGQKLERVKRSGHRSGLQRFFRKLIATVPGAGRSVIMFSQIYPMPIFTAKILINLKETLHCKVGTPAPSVPHLTAGSEINHGKQQGLCSGRKLSTQKQSFPAMLPEENYSEKQ